MNLIEPKKEQTGYADEQINPDTRRGRFIAHIADSSALSAGSHVHIIQLICITTLVTLLLSQGLGGLIGYYSLMNFKFRSGLEIRSCGNVNAARAIRH